jgi:hypothetical protein
LSAVAFELDETLVSMHLAEPSIDSAAGDASRKFHGDAGIAVATLVVTNVVALEKILIADRTSDRQAHTHTRAAAVARHATDSATIAGTAGAPATERTHEHDPRLAGS